MDNIITITLDALRESPFNPRKIYNQTALEELASSIAAQGLLQPIVVRPAPNRPGDTRNLQITHELVFGHRRLRAAQLAGLDEVPAIVRDMSDEEAAIAQVHENTQRADVTAIEEADSFAHLTAAHKMKPDDIAAAIGKSRSYVYGRLKLARMAPEVRKAVTDEGLPPEIALEVARLPHHNLQRQALKDLTEHEYTSEGKKPIGWSSYRQAKRLLKGMFDTHLDKAPFDITDSLLAARAGACTTCPRRAGNDPDLQSVLAADICTDKACYQVKVDAHMLRRIAELKQAGHQVIEGDEAKALLQHSWSNKPKGYTPLERQMLESPNVEDYTVAAGLALMGAAAPKTTFVRNPHNGQLIECVTDSQAEDIVEAAWPEAASDGGASTPSAAARAQTHPREDLRTPEDRAVTYPHWERVSAEIMKRAAARTNRSLDELRWAALATIEVQYEISDNVLDAMGWRDELTALENSNVEDKPSDEVEFTLRKLRTATADELATFIVLQAISLAPYGGFDPVGARAQKLAIAAHYGVDVIAAAGLQEQTDDAGGAGERTAQADAFEEAAA